MPLRRLAALLALTGSALALAGCANLAAMAPDGRIVYWVNGQMVNAAPVDGSTPSALDVGLPWISAAALDPDGAHGYVVQDSGLKRVRTSDLRTDGTASLGSLAPQYAAAAPGALYLAQLGTAAVRVDTASLRVGARKTLAKLGGAFATDQRGFVTPDGRWVLFASNGDGSVVDRIDTASFAGDGPLVERSVAMGAAGAASLALSGDGSTAYVGGNGRLAAIDVATMRVVRQADVVDGTVLLEAIAASRWRPRVYAVTGELPTARLITIDTARMAVVGEQRLAFGSSNAWAVLTPDGTTLVLGDESGLRQKVTVADAPNAFASGAPLRRDAAGSVAIEQWARPSVAGGTLRLSIVTRSGVRACSTTARSTTTRPQRLRCVLGPAARALLARGPLLLRSTISFAPDGFAAASTTWQLRLARTPLPRPTPPPVTG